MWCAVNEVCPGDNGSRKAYCGPVKRSHENFRVGIKSVGYLEVIRYEGGKRLPADIGAFRVTTGDGDVCTAVYRR